MRHGTRQPTIPIAIVVAAGMVVTMIAASPAATADTPPAEAPAVVLTAMPPIDGRPVDIALRAGDDALYVVTQGGTVQQVSGDAVTTVLDVTDLITSGGERGLLGLAFSPNGDRAYVNFTALDGDNTVNEFAIDQAGMFLRDSLRTVLAIDDPYGNHNGGDLAFGPDGMLFIGTCWRKKKCRWS